MVEAFSVGERVNLACPALVIGLHPLCAFPYQ